MEKKQIITEACVIKAHREGKGEIIVRDKAIITPLARDTAKEKDVLFRKESAPEGTIISPVLTRINTPKVVAIGSDHGGFGYKSVLRAFVKEMGWGVLDVGTDSEEACDYPDFAFAVGRLVQSQTASLGIMIDGAGMGSAMACNKMKEIRAACAYNSFTAWNVRAHNDANVLTLGSRTLGIEVCKRIVKVFLETAFEGGRHAARVNKICEIELKRGAP